MLNSKVITSESTTILSEILKWEKPVHCFPEHKTARTRRREERKGRLKAVVKGERKKALFSHGFPQINAENKTNDSCFYHSCPGSFLRSFV